jgi:hypothetical protein
MCLLGPGFGSMQQTILGIKNSRVPSLVPIEEWHRLGLGYLERPHRYLSLDPEECHHLQNFQLGGVNWC